MAEVLDCQISRNGASENPADNRITVRLAIQHGVILLEIPVPGIVVQKEDRKALHTIIDDALAKLHDATAAKLA